jgi:hypothetical protein
MAGMWYASLGVADLIMGVLDQMIDRLDELAETIADRSGR